jgi:hypothetical protein
MRAFVLVAVAFVSVLSSPVGAQTSAVDPGLAKGKGEVERGEYDAAVATLIPVVRRLGAAPGREAEVADACLHLGIAYAGLGQMSPAKSQFVRALMLDPSLQLDPETAPPAAVEAFEAARREGESEGVVSPDRRAKKKGAAGKLVALGLVGAGVAAAAAGSGAADATPVALPTFIPIEASPYIQLLNADPAPGTASRFNLTVTLTVRATNAGDLQFIFVAEALTADGRACLSGQTSPFSTGHDGSVTATFTIQTRCPVPFTTEALQISLQDPDTDMRPFHASYRGGYSVTP